MDPGRLFILLNHLRLSAKRLECEARAANRRGDVGEALVLFGAAQGFRSAAEALEEAASPPAGQGERHLEVAR